jgi:putative tricarboxylic transport membrane protein
MQAERKVRTPLRMLVAALTVLALAVVSAGCGTTRGPDAAADAGDRQLRMIIPNSPGGGYDLTGRAAAKVMEDEGLTGRFEISNMEGASGTVAMQRMLNEEGSDDLMLLMGLGIVGAVYTNQSEATPLKMTPIARLVEEQEAIVVPADSPFQTVDDFVQAWKKDPGGLVVGGGSSPGGPDHLFPMQLADKVGVTPEDVNYIEYDGGGPLTTALLGEKIDVGMTGLGEFEGQIEDGTLRVLAVSGDERLEGVDAPTLTESGVDLVFTNWRGVLAPPGLSDEERQELTDLLTDMHDTEAWQQVLQDNGWTDNFATGEEFETFLAEQDKRVEDTLTELGLT